jgi:hypothetical protein
MNYVLRPTAIGFVVGILVWAAIQALFVPAYMLLRARTHPRRQSALDAASATLSTAGGIVVGGIAATGGVAVPSLVAGSALALLFLVITIRRYGQTLASNGELAGVVVAIIAALVGLALRA